MTKRYLRNIEIIGQKGQETLSKSSVAVIGVGGLGSSALYHLACCGIGNLTIIDGDIVEESNLNRQFIHKSCEVGNSKSVSATQTLLEFNPHLNIRSYSLSITKENFKELIGSVDYVLDCADSFESKLIINDCCLLNNIPFSYASLYSPSRFVGELMTILPGRSLCLRAVAKDSGGTRIKGVLSPMPGLLGTLQAMECVKYLLNLGNLITNSPLSYNLLTNSMNRRTALSYCDRDCVSCTCFKDIDSYMPFKE